MPKAPRTSQGGIPIPNLRPGQLEVGISLASLETMSHPSLLVLGRGRSSLMEGLGPVG